MKALFDMFFGVHNLSLAQKYAELVRLVYESDASRLTERKLLVDDICAANIPHPGSQLGYLIQDHPSLFQHERAVVLGTGAFHVYLAMFGQNIFSDRYFCLTNDVDLALCRDVRERRPRLLPQHSHDTSARRQIEAFEDCHLDLTTPHFKYEPLNSIWLHDFGTYAYVFPHSDSPCFSFLLRDSIPGVLLHDAGIPVRVPHPVRFSLEKLVNSTARLRKGYTFKPGKDRKQALVVLDYLKPDTLSPDLCEEFCACGKSAMRLLRDTLTSCMEDELLQGPWLDKLLNLSNYPRRKMRSIRLLTP